MWFLGYIFGVAGHAVHVLLILALIIFAINRTLLNKWEEDIKVVLNHYYKLESKTSLFIKHFPKRLTLSMKTLRNYFRLRKLKGRKVVNFGRVVRSPVI